MNVRIARAATFVTLGLLALATHASAQEGTEEASEETPTDTDEAHDTDEASDTEKPPRHFYLLLTSGLGYAALSEDRPDSMGSSSAS